MSPPLDERDRIREAMDRLFTDRAVTSNGALTIVALAIEAEVKRNALTQRHTDLKKEFYARRAALGLTSDVEDTLRAEIVKLKKTIANKNKKLAQLKADVPALVRAVHVLTLENEELREQLTLPKLNVVPLRPRPDDWRQ